MREVEVKAKLRNPEEVLGKLSALGITFPEPTVQEDTIYAESADSMDSFLSNSTFLRIRVENGEKVLFTAKYNPNRNKADTRSVPLEYEVEVSSKGEMESILNLLGFVEGVRVRKSRRKARYQDWEIGVDEVDELGSFMEVEEVVPEDADHTVIHKKMEEFLKTLGIAEEDSHSRRYDVLMLERKFGL